jgi:ubiquinone/menaquinone biosynthesis C-methylase UbiE
MFNECSVKMIMDLGCGDGRDSYFFADEGFEVEAVDFSENAIKIIENEKCERKIHAVKMDYSKGLEFEDNEFDAVYSHIGLHYFDDKTTTMIFDEIYRVLNTGGIFGLRVKSVEDAKYGMGKKIEDGLYVDESGAKRYANTKRVKHFFSEEYMSEKLKRFKEVKIGTVSEAVHQVRGKYESSLIEAIAIK